ncbi:EpsG family protein [Acinetobacter sp. YH12227]|uniref:EpsG family protein n=1 Tax=Acinetobacter sp. YH12227 TaxID=2601158 RepID=UPI0015D3ACB1
MLPYFLVFFLVNFVTIFEKTVLNRRAILFPLFFLVLLFSLRNISVGVDTNAYTLNYKNHNNVYVNGFLEDIEIGYQILDRTVIYFTYNYFWLFLISSVIVISLYLYTLKKISPNYSISVFLYISLGYYTFFFNGLRQGIALALCFFSLKYLFRKEFLKFLLVVFIASLFHKSALIVIPIYFLSLLKISEYYKVISCFIFSLIFSSMLINYLANNNERYEIYKDVSGEIGGLYTLLYFTFIGLFFKFLANKIKIKDIIFNYSMSIYWCGLAIVYPLVFLGMDPSGPQRVLYYFTFTSMIFITLVMSKIKNMLLLIFIYFQFVLYFYFVTRYLGGFYPYKINPIFEIF